jgi:hypothetical protein
MRCFRSLVRFLPLLVVLVTPSGAPAVTATVHALAPGRVAINDGATRKFVLQGRWFDDQSQMLNPTAATATLRVVGTGAGDGDTGIIPLPSAGWRAVGRGFEFSDRSAANGVRRIRIKPSKRGGSLKIVGRGPNWPYAITQAQDGVQVTLSIGGALLWQAELPGACGTIGRNVRGRFRAANKRAPKKGSTWATIQKTIIARHGCTEAACHGAAQQGGLDLRPKVAYANLVGAFSELGQQNRVERGSRQDSFLYRKLAAATTGVDDVPGSPMPLNGDKLSPDELEAIRLWIQTGAPETGTVAGTDKLLGSCLPPAGPQKIAPPPAPAASEGVQFHAPPWEIPAKGEDEVCYATYYDIDAQVPADMKTPCDPDYFGPGKTCFVYNRTELTQDPNSHHSIIHIYLGQYAPNHPGFGFVCHGGASDGQACDPQQANVCGAGGECYGKPKSSLACLTFGPPDFNQGGNPIAGGGSNTSPSFGGSQQPFARNVYPPGVWAALPTKGVIVWNSHAFNLTNEATTNEQYLNMYFLGAAARQFPVRGIFDSRDIFVQDVPPFAAREYCKTITFRKGSRITELSTHAHKRSSLFRVWGPGIAEKCRSTSEDPGACLPEPGTPVLTTTEYNDPAQFQYPEPLALDSDVPAERRFKFCSLYDNGASDPATVKRNSTSPIPPTFGTLAPGGPCFVPGPGPFARDLGISCLDGPKKGQLCGGDDRFCDSTPGAGDGQCDACPLKGGVTTEDEMMILLGNYYCAHDSECEGACQGGTNDGQLCYGSDAACDSTPGAGDGKCRAGYGN